MHVGTLRLLVSQAQIVHYKAKNCTTVLWHKTMRSPNFHGPLKERVPVHSTTARHTQLARNRHIVAQYVRAVRSSKMSMSIVHTVVRGVSGAWAQCPGALAPDTRCQTSG